MDLRSLLMALVWFAALGGVVLLGAKVLGTVGRKAASSL